MTSLFLEPAVLGTRHQPPVTKTDMLIATSKWQFRVIHQERTVKPARRVARIARSAAKFDRRVKRRPLTARSKHDNKIPQPLLPARLFDFIAGPRHRFAPVVTADEIKKTARRGSAPRYSRSFQNGNYQGFSESRHRFLHQPQFGPVIRIEDTASLILGFAEATGKLAFRYTGLLKGLNNGELDRIFGIDRDRDTVPRYRLRKSPSLLDNSAKSEAQCFSRIGQRLVFSVPVGDCFRDVGKSYEDTPIGISLEICDKYEIHCTYSLQALLVMIDRFAVCVSGRCDWHSWPSIEAQLLLDQSHIGRGQFAGFDSCNLSVEPYPVVRSLSFVFEDLGAAEVPVFSDLAKLSQKLIALHFLSFLDFFIAQKCAHVNAIAQKCAISQKGF